MLRSPFVGIPYSGGMTTPGALAIFGAFRAIAFGVQDKSRQAAP